MSGPAWAGGRASAWSARGYGDLSVLDRLVEDLRQHPQDDLDRVLGQPRTAAVSIAEDLSDGAHAFDLLVPGQQLRLVVREALLCEALVVERHRPQRGKLVPPQDPV